MPWENKVWWIKKHIKNAIEILSFAYIYVLFHISFTFECKWMGEIMVYFTPEIGKAKSFRITSVLQTSSLVLGAE